MRHILSLWMCRVKRNEEMVHGPEHCPIRSPHFQHTNTAHYSNNKALSNQSQTCTDSHIFGFTIHLDCLEWWWIQLTWIHLLNNSTIRSNSGFALQTKRAQDSIQDSTINQDLRSQIQLNIFNHTSQIQFNSVFEPVLQPILQFIRTH